MAQNEICKAARAGSCYCEDATRMGVTFNTMQDMDNLQRKRSQGLICRCHDDISWVGKSEVLLHTDYLCLAVFSVLHVRIF